MGEGVVLVVGVRRGRRRVRGTGGSRSSGKGQGWRKVGEERRGGEWEEEDD